MSLYNTADNLIKMKTPNPRHFYVQTANSLWVFRGSIRKMKHKDKEYTLIIAPKQRILPRVPTMKGYATEISESFIFCGQPVLSFKIIMSRMLIYALEK